MMMGVGFRMKKSDWQDSARNDGSWDMCLMINMCLHTSILYENWWEMFLSSDGVQNCDDIVFVQVTTTHMLDVFEKDDTRKVTFFSGAVKTEA